MFVYRKQIFHLSFVRTKMDPASGDCDRGSKKRPLVFFLYKPFDERVGYRGFKEI